MQKTRHISAGWLWVQDKAVSSNEPVHSPTLEEPTWRFRDEQGFPFDIWVNYFGEPLPLVLPVLSRGKADGELMRAWRLVRSQIGLLPTSHLFFIVPKIVATMALSIVASVCVTFVGSSLVFLGLGFLFYLLHAGLQRQYLHL